MKKLFLLMIILFLGFASGFSQVSITSTGGMLKFTGLTGANTNLPISAGVLYTRDMDVIGGYGGGVTIVFQRAGDNLATIRVDFADISNKQGQSTSADYVAYIVAAGWVGTGSTTVVVLSASLFDILTDDLTLTTSFADLGVEIDMQGKNELYIYLKLDINDASDIRFKALGKWESGGTDEYNMVISTVSSSDIKIDVEYVEFNNDTDQNVILNVTTNGGIFYIQLQAMEGVDGGVDAIFTGVTKGVKK